MTLIPCNACNDKNKGKYEIERLQKLLNRLKMVIKNPAKTNALKDWNMQFRCKFGLPCQEFRRRKNELEIVTRELSPYLVEAVQNPEYSALYGTILASIRGSFPSIYYEIEKLHRNARKG